MYIKKLTMVGVLLSMAFVACKDPSSSEKGGAFFV